VTTTVVVNGRQMPRPLICRSSTLEKINPNMRLTLRCSGEAIAYALEYRESSTSWVVTEEEGSPEVYTRR
jgi:hypothetical protein